MFVNTVSNKTIRYKYALGMRDTQGKEFHTFHEILFLESGSVRLTCDGGIFSVAAGSAIIVPKGNFHQYDPMCEEKDYLRSVLQFEALQETEEYYGSMLHGVTVIQNLPTEVLRIYEMMKRLTTVRFETEDKINLLSAYFTALMTELKYSSSEKLSRNPMNNDLTEIISYIDSHYLEHITLKSIADGLSFSRSSISHKFQSVMKISIYSYILQKKLTYAYEMIRKGTPPTSVAYLCGFSEYSGFYKLYKKYFGFSPSETEKFINEQV